MSLQSHLAELEKKHQALEEQIMIRLEPVPAAVRAVEKPLLAPFDTAPEKQDPPRLAPDKPERIAVEKATAPVQVARKPKPPSQKHAKPQGNKKSPSGGDDILVPNF